jgi:hypothetical protein
MHARMSAIVLVALVAVAGCSSTGQRPTEVPTASVVTSQAPTARALPIRTQSPPPPGTPQPCMAAAMDGILEVVGDDLGIREGDGAFRPVVWPYGWSATSGPPAVLIDPAGQPVARTGDSVRIDGGELDGVWFACPDGVEVTSRS